MLLLFSTLSYGQAWSGILSTSRAIDWGHAGLQATFPDGETTPNPWTPPTRPACTTAQAGITVPVSSATSESAILTALTSCHTANPTGSYLLLGSGTFTFGSNFNLYGANNVTLRGSGPMSTFISPCATCGFNIGGASGSGYGLVTAGSNLAAGSTSVTVGTLTGTPTVGNLAWFVQCDTGQTASSPIISNTTCTGSHSDNGGLYFCGLDTSCMTDTPGGGNNSYLETQAVVITGSTNNGNGTYTITFTPGLYLPNWSTSQAATVAWQTQADIAVGNGLENLTVVLPQPNAGGPGIAAAYDSWITGVRVVGQPVNGYSLSIGGRTTFDLVANSYVAAQGTNATSGTQGFSHSGNYSGGESTNLALNNIIQGGMTEGGGGPEGVVLGYNYNRDDLVGYPQNAEFQHQAGSAFLLREGNVWGVSRDDNTWGTHNLNTWFRNYIECGDPPYVLSNYSTLDIDSFSRFDNVIGNALGSAGCTTYQGGGTGTIYEFNLGGTDPLAQPSTMRWGNYDTVSNAVRWNAAEVPTSLSGNAAPLENTVPTSTTLPPSFFLNVTSPLPAGGTGLSWWKVCTSWTTFPTACAGTQIPQFPPIGPEVTGGNNINGYAYDTPAVLAYKNLPIDTTYQHSYTVTGSSWSSGTETLTISGLPGGTGSGVSIMGGFQLTGANSACNPSGNELYITGESPTTIKYALASNPSVTCTGTMLWPDVRQFDARVYENDPSGDPPPQAPTGLQAVVN